MGTRIDEQNQRLSEKIKFTHQSIREKIDQLEPELKQEYEALEENSSILNEKLNSQKRELIELEHKIISADQKTQTEEVSNALKMIDLKKHFNELNAEKEQLLEETNADITDEQFREDITNKMNQEKENL